MTVEQSKPTEVSQLGTGTLPDTKEEEVGLDGIAEVVEPVTTLLEPLISVLEASRQWFFVEILSTASLAQLIAMALTLVIAFTTNRPFRRFIEKIGQNSPPFIRYRILRTVASISLPIIWAIGLWISFSILVGLGEPIVLIRLVYSLINAWILIRIVTTLIPSAYWSSVFSWFAWSIAALNAVGLLGRLIDWMDSNSLAVGTLRISLWTVVKGGLVVGFLLWVAITLSTILQARIERSKSVSPSMQVLLSKLLRIALIAIAVMIGLKATGIDLTALAVFSGALGLGIGLGMQRTVSNLVAGFTMLADKSIKPGDVIEIETGDGPTYGTVKTLNARYVSVLSRSGTETLIPNELLITSPVTNWSFSNKKVRRGVPVGVSYNTDVEHAMTLCVEAATACSRVLPDPPPRCLLRGFGDNSVDLELRFWIVDPEDGVANIGSDVYLEIWKRFQSNGIELPFPQRDLHLRTGFDKILDP